MAETQMTAPHGARMINRPFTRENSPLRGWSAADRLVLEHLGTDDLGSLLVVNDEFGALTVGLAEHEPSVWSDSIVSRTAIDANLVANGFEPLGVRAIPGDVEPAGSFDTVVIRIPKTSALLRHQLATLRFHIGIHTRVIGAGMVRHIHRSTITSFENAFGAAITSPAKRKARLILAEVDPSTKPPRSIVPEPGFVTADGITVVVGPGVFSAGHLDVGSALLLDTLRSLVPVPPAPATTIADLGTGSGVIGTTLAMRWPRCRFVLADASDLAVATARRTWAANKLPASQGRFDVSDGLDLVEDGSLHMVVTNPPFHQGQALDHELTDRLMADAARALRPDGRMFVVAQRHLNMHTRLRRWFADVTVASKHPSHVVLVATQPKS